MRYGMSDLCIGLMLKSDSCMCGPQDHTPSLSFNIVRVQLYTPNSWVAISVLVQNHLMIYDFICICTVVVKSTPNSEQCSRMPTC